MTLTTTERLTVDGVDLKTLAKNVSTLGALLRAPSRRGGNAVVAGRSGVVRTPDKLYDVVTFALPMWVVGCDDNGVIPTGSTDRIEFYKRVDELTGLFNKDGVLDVRHTLPDTTVRQADCECLTIMDFTTDGVSPIGKVSVELQNLNACWADVSAVTSTLAVGATAATAFNGATAPLDDGTYVITGPVTNPRITDSAKTSAWVQYNGTVAALQTLTINAATWAVTGGGGMTANIANLVMAGTTGRLMRLTPTAARGYAPQLSGSTTTAATTLAVTGRRKYLVG